MWIQVLYFAVLRERIGKSDELLELPAGASAGDAIAALTARYPAVASLQGRFRVAVGRAFVADPDRHALAEGDELAIIPPVAGGAM